MVSRKLRLPIIIPNRLRIQRAEFKLKAYPYLVTSPYHALVLAIIKHVQGLALMYYDPLETVLSGEGLDWITTKSGFHNWQY